MKRFIEELYYGNNDPQNSGFEDDEGVQRELRTISVNEDWLTEHLAGEEKSASWISLTPGRPTTATPPWTASSPASGWARGLCWIHSCCRMLRRRTICKNKTNTNFSKGCPVELTWQPFLLLHRCEGDRHV